MVHKRRREYFTSLTNNYGSSEAQEDKRYCVHCETFGFPYIELKPRVYQPHEYINGSIPSDSDNWLQCYECGKVYPVEHGKQESTIAGFRDVPETIHDSKRLKVEHFVKPRSDTQKNNKRNNRLEPEELDTDIQQRINRGAKLTYYSDNSPDL